MAAYMGENFNQAVKYSPGISENRQSNLSHSAIKYEPTTTAKSYKIKNIAIICQCSNTFRVPLRDF